MAVMAHREKIIAPVTHKKNNSPSNTYKKIIAPVTHKCYKKQYYVLPS